MVNKTRKPSKAASLTGDLLVRKKWDKKAGFVLTPPADPPLADLQSEETAAAAEHAPITATEPAPVKATEPKPPTAAAVLNTLDHDDRIPPPNLAPESPAAAAYVRLGDWSNPTAQTSGPQALVQALREGELERAEQLFGTMTGLPSDKLKAVLYGETGRDLALACRALGFDHLQFASTLILSRKLGLAETESDPTVFGSASELFEDTAQESALDVLRRWRRNQAKA